MDVENNETRRLIFIIMTQILTPEEKNEITFFAKTEFRNKDSIFGIKQGEDRRRHTYIIGKSGTGKTTLISNMAIDDIRKGRGVAVIDPQSGKVIAIIDATNLVNEGKGNGEVLNGIAYQPDTRKLYMTGKFWPTLFEVKVRKN